MFSLSVATFALTIYSVAAEPLDPNNAKQAPASGRDYYAWKPIAQRDPGMREYESMTSSEKREERKAGINSQGKRFQPVFFSRKKRTEEAVEHGSDYSDLGMREYESMTSSEKREEAGRREAGKRRKQFFPRFFARKNVNKEDDGTIDSLEHVLGTEEHGSEKKNVTTEDGTIDSLEHVMGTEEHGSDYLNLEELLWRAPKNQWNKNPRSKGAKRRRKNTRKNAGNNKNGKKRKNNNNIGKKRKNRSLLWRAPKGEKSIVKKGNNLKKKKNNKGLHRLHWHHGPNGGKEGKKNSKANVGKKKNNGASKNSRNKGKDARKGKQKGNNGQKKKSQTKKINTGKKEFGSDYSDISLIQGKEMTRRTYDEKTRDFKFHHEVL